MWRGDGAHQLPRSAKGTHFYWAQLCTAPHARLAPPPPPFSIDFWHQKNTDYNNSPFHISQCFVLKLSDLQAVNVGLFDQYFRLTGE